MKILIAEDDSTSRLLVSRNLTKWGYDVVEVEDGTSALEELVNVSDPPQIAILDWMMPGLDGPEVCRKVRKVKSGAFQFLILLSSRDAKEDVVSGFDAGADDYIRKPFNAEELRMRLRAAERIVNLTAQLERANRILEILAMTDELTSLLNRPAILTRLQEEIARAERNEEPLSVIMTDIDHFKRINDEHGHVCGDHVLREFAWRVKSALRPYDSVGRYGGEEFLIVLPNIPEEECMDIGERLRTAVCDQPIEYEHLVLTVESSFGLAWIPAKTPVSSDDILKFADDLLYRAKAGGRNRVVKDTFVPANSASKKAK